MVDLLVSDGEIDAFKILRVTDVAKIIRSSTGSYKANSALVVIDFLYRHGFAQLPTTFASCRTSGRTNIPSFLFLRFLFELIMTCES